MTTPTAPTLTSPPTPPSRSDPNNFAARGDAFMSWFPTAWTQLTAALQWITDRMGEIFFSASQAQSDAAIASASSLSAQSYAAVATTAAGQAGVIAAAVSSATPSVAQFSGTGTQSAFVLGVAPPSKALIDVYVGGSRVNQDSFSITGTTLTITPAPPVGTNNIVVKSAATTVLAITPASDYGLITESATSTADYGAIF